MRLLVHDYCGHPFQAQLSRSLATRGHRVLHLFSTSVVSPQGALSKRSTDPSDLEFEGLALPAQIDRETYLRRYLQERAYGSLLAARIIAFSPHIVISANTPLEAQRCAARAARSVDAKFVFWLQDVHGIAIDRLLSRRIGLIGHVVGGHFRRIEQRLLRRSNAIVAISDDFRPILQKWGVRPELVAVIQNWASLEELPERPKANSWSQRHELEGKFCFLYSGTLGMKHNPDLLLQLALAYQGSKDVRVVVISEGAGANWLANKAAELSLETLRVLPFQPYSVLPDVMGSADVLIAVLEPDAGVFSVPSKVLSYLCAARALLLAVPPENLAARTVLDSGAGAVVRPDDLQAFLMAAERLRVDDQRRSEMSNNARRYAHETFDISRVTDRFEELFVSLAGKGGSNEARVGLRRRGVYR